MTKKSLLLMLPLVAMLSCGKKEGKEENASENATSITIKGSDTVLPLAQKESEEQAKTNKEVTASIVGGGTGVGITALLEGTTDIAMASRELKTEEKLKFTEAKKDVEVITVAYDALAVIINPANKADKLTREQLEKIYTGEIKNWKEVGGADEKIVVYSRESSSGTYEFFKEEVMDKKNYASDVLSMPATGAIVQAVEQTKGAIGYVGLAYSTPKIKMVSVSYDQGKTFVAPSVAAAKDKSYPIARPLFYIFDKTNAAKVKSVVDYILSEQGQKIVTEVGYIPLK
jgi:phosphate transport system substrate-binding protein